MRSLDITIRRMREAQSKITAAMRSNNACAVGVLLAEADEAIEKAIRIAIGVPHEDPQTPQHVRD